MAAQYFQDLIEEMSGTFDPEYIGRS